MQNFATNRNPPSSKAEYLWLCKSVGSIAYPACYTVRFYLWLGLRRTDAKSYKKKVRNYDIRVALDAPERKFSRFELDHGLAYVLRSP